MTARPIRVLQVIDSLGMGGAETWLIELLRFWSRNKTMQMDFLATGNKPGIFDDEARQLGARIEYLRYSRSHLPHFTAQFRSFLRTQQYDAIHDHQDYVSGWHFLMGTGQLPPVRITHVHNPSYQISTNYGATVSRRMTARVGKSLVGHYSTHITATSRQVITEYGFDKPSFAHIPRQAVYCGFRTERFIGERSAIKSSLCAEFNWPANAIVILFVGRTDLAAELGHPQNHKNSGFAVSVGIEASKLDARVRVLLVGASSPVTPVLKKRVSEAGMASRILFPGILLDVERLMLGSDVLLFPSRGEGLGMVAVEAQAAGLPVLASDVVPRECVVIPELVRFQRLQAGEAGWALDLLELAKQPHDNVESNRRVKASAFSIEASASTLFRLYTEGKLPC